MRTLAVIAGAALIAAAPSAAAGQGSGYRFPAGDTLRYREVTESRVELRGPAGSSSLALTHRAVVAMTSSGEGVRAWYDSLSLLPRSRGTIPTLPTDLVAGLPFELHVSPTGSVDVLSAPVFPPEIAEFSDLTQEFVDFLVPLPERELADGLPWAAVVERGGGEGEDGYRATQSLTVIGDTVLNGERGWVIRMTQRIHQQVTRATPGGPAVSVVEGEDHGIAVVSVQGGRMLSRQREGVLRGTLTLSSGGRSVELPQTQTYTHRIELLPGP